MGKRIITPSEVILENLDERLSCKGLRRLGTDLDTNILIGRVYGEYDNIILPENKNGEEYIIARGKGVSVLLRNVHISFGLVFANIVAMDVYTAFELESLPFSIIFNSKIKDNDLMILNARVEVHQPLFYKD